MGPLPPGAVTALVASYRRPRLLDRCLESLLAEPPGRGADEVVAALHESDGEGRAVAEVWARRDPRVRLARASRASRSAARNAALPLCRGDWCYMIDDDAELEPGSWEALRRAVAARPEAAAVGGPNLLPAGAGAFERAADAALSSPLGAGLMRARYAEGGPAGAVDERSLIACNLAVRRELLAPGGFDERLDYGEETLLLARLRLSGRELIREPGLRVRHRRRAGLPAFARQAWRSGLGRARQTWILPRSLAPECLAPPALLLALAAAPFWRPAAAAAALYAALPAALGLAAARREGLRIGALAAGLAAAGHLAYGAGFWAESLRRAFARRGPAE